MSERTTSKESISSAEDSHASQLVQTVGEKPSPSMLEEMMGFPLGWTDLGHSETP